MTKHFKFSGRIEPGSLLHSTQEEAPDGALIPPTWVPTTWGNVAQYAPTVKDTNPRYDPAGDCQGSFMSAAVATMSRNTQPRRAQLGTTSP